MRWALALGTVVACSGPKAAQHDARIGDPCPCSHPSAGVLSCNLTCGNGQIDTCYTTSPLGCHCVTEAPEPCDGSAVPSCSDAGYYGGTMLCQSSCQLDTSACDACAPTDVGCSSLTDYGLYGPPVAVSGVHVAVLTQSKVALLDRTTLTAEVALGLNGGVVGVPAGWLVATAAPALVPLSSTGTIGPAAPLPDGALGPEMVYGAGGRVLVAWNANINMQPHVLAAIADTSGTIVVAAQELFAAGEEPFGIATDGTSFFVGTEGHLARITPAGQITTFDGFPLPVAGGGRSYVTWSGTTGWYVTYDGGGTGYTTFHAQRFDASGAKVGGAIAIDLGLLTTDFLADGSDLVAARFSGHHVGIVRINASGVAGPAVDVGVDDPRGFSFARLAHLGSNVLVVWERASDANVAEVAPP